MTFDSFTATLGGEMGTWRVDGGSLTGSEYLGIVGPSGEIRMTEMPEAKAGSCLQNSLAGMFPDILTLLPPFGAGEEPGWPHAFVLATGGGLDEETSFAGTGRFAGDTTWNGIASRVIVSEGTFHMEGTWVPEGAPAEVELMADGDATTVYV